MFHTPTIVATTLLVIGSLLGTQANAEHLYDPVSLLPAACELKDTICAFEAVISERPTTSYTLYQVKALRKSAEQFHELVRCKAPLAHVKTSFHRVCAYAARIDRRLWRSCGFRPDRELATTWRYVQEEMEAVRCLLAGNAVAPPAVGYDFPGRSGFDRTAPSFNAPRHGQPPSRFDSRPELLPPPPAHAPSSRPARPIPDTRTTRAEALETLLLSLLR
ncbi:MAG: hypothetical protein CMJ64_27125 [Planctomycetaceae bacterium]|nr:hypothetical protein [Planctomycetaceae bacterium]